MILDPYLGVPMGIPMGICMGVPMGLPWECPWEFPLEFPWGFPWEFPWGFPREFPWGKRERKWFAGIHRAQEWNIPFREPPRPDIYIERERDTYINIYIYIYIHTHIYIYIYIVMLYNVMAKGCSLYVVEHVSLLQMWTSYLAWCHCMFWAHCSSWLVLTSASRKLVLSDSCIPGTFSPIHQCSLLWRGRRWRKQPRRQMQPPKRPWRRWRQRRHRRHSRECQRISTKIVSTPVHCIFTRACILRTHLYTDTKWRDGQGWIAKSNDGMYVTLVACVMYSHIRVCVCVCVCTRRCV